ncbi:tyrosine-type recombinase/integrase [Neobacillus sp. BF23-41]|uniref:tyrosine-type recombinase/integrase n=1 Tax=Neobacillus sp. BF23-41 TaxID=3240280 RepID=UPI0034E470E4
MGLIYKIENHINNKVYIGQTINTIQRRYNGTSLKAIYENMHNDHLRRAMRKYGLDNFSIEILIESDSIDDLNGYEQYYINIFNSMDPNHGYNKRDGGKNNKASTELKQKFSEIQTELKGIKVICVDNNKVYSSLTEAAKEYNVKIDAIKIACKNHLKGATCGGMQWDYYIEGKTYELYDKNFYNAQPVICINSKEVFSSIREAERKTGLGGIGACCRGEAHSIGGMQWAYYKDGEEYELKKFVSGHSRAVIFVTERHPHRMSIGQMRYIIKRISSRAVINKEIHPHQLRHSYATHLLNNGAPIDVIQSLLGHEKSETTRIYAQLSGSLRREFYRKYF